MKQASEKKAIHKNRKLGAAFKVAQPESQKSIKFVDLFAGIGGFRFALQQVCKERNLEASCVLSSDIDEECQKSYFANFEEMPHGDITQIDESSVPKHDILLGGFPCQPFSICGDMMGFEDTRGTLFFHIARILKAKRPKAFLLENVKLLTSHDQGKTLQKILRTLRDLGYFVDYKVLNALHYGLPQKRERIFLVGFDKNYGFDWPIGNVPMTPLSSILEKDVPSQYYASAKIRESRLSRMSPTQEPTIWHENKAGHISAYPFSCALRAGASYNYLLVNGERRLTPREMLRLQGFPESFKIVSTYQQIRKQAGNSVAVPVVSAVLKKMLEALSWGKLKLRASFTAAEGGCVPGFA
ncbi:MAG: DNA cytosine methyltransferase [Blastocatellia bacterium]